MSNQAQISGSVEVEVMDGGFALRRIPAYVQIYYPCYEALPENMTANDAFMSRDTAVARFPCVAESDWEVATAGTFPRSGLVILDLDGPFVIGATSRT